MSLLYYVPGVRVATADVLSERGISALAGVHVSSVAVTRGPGDNGPGVVCAAQGASRPGFYPDSQVWHPCDDGNWMVGWDASTTPKPASLARVEQIAGHLVTLGDDQDWLVPVARSFPIGTALPEALVIGPNGELVSEPLPKFAQISQSAERVWEAFMAASEREGVDDGIQDDRDLEVADAFDIATQALALNYHVSKWELSALRLMTTDTMWGVLRALIDFPAIEAELKKNLGATPPVTSNGSGGVEVSSLGTSPALPISTGTEG